MDKLFKIEKQLEQIKKEIFERDQLETEDQYIDK